ncbi:MAG: nucleotide exchange factor GrpE [Acidiphilium sp.]|nr:nucleotide exchange factor GrpE [Acidiphilium sp.]MDD4934862.1 nucleotide exchange factor GrpE [Acidiphilium sp.]
MTENTPQPSSEPATADIDVAVAESDPLAATQERIALLEAEAAEYRDKWIRAQAEMENLRTRTRREVDEARLYAVQKFASDVAETAENLRRGIDSLPPQTADEPVLVAKLREGFSGIERSFVAMLERNGIRAEDPVGAMFDANRHQSMAEQESADAPPGTIMQAWSRTWTLNGRLLKPAMVVVAKAPSTRPLDIEA